MDGSAQLLQLVYLLRSSAEAARDLARMRREDCGEIERLADRTDVIADAFETVAASAAEPG